eukprot:SAG22_NODE_301_length_12744_cov_19.648189_5_plen_205_part_00
MVQKRVVETALHLRRTRVDFGVQILLDLLRGQSFVTHVFLAVDLLLNLDILLPFDPDNVGLLHFMNETGFWILNLHHAMLKMESRLNEFQAEVSANLLVISRFFDLQVLLIYLVEHYAVLRPLPVKTTRNNPIQLIVIHVSCGCHFDVEFVDEGLDWRNPPLTLSSVTTISPESSPQPYHAGTRTRSADPYDERRKELQTSSHH